MLGFAVRLLPYALAFTSSLCIMILELVSSRLVARHVGSSLTVWTSVIGIILGGICLGNVLGGRLADRVDPRRAVGPLFALGAFLTLCSLWVNGYIGNIIPSPEHLNWELRTVIVVTLDFLIPATILGMVGPVVAKIAVEHAAKAGSAIGDVYFCGAVGSIAGTFLCGFVLMYLAPTSIIVILVALTLVLLAASLIGSLSALAIGIPAALCLLLGSIPAVMDWVGRQIGPVGSIDLGSHQLNYVQLAGNALGCVLAAIGLAQLLRAAREAGELATSTVAAPRQTPPDQARPGLSDLAALAFIASLVFMALEMVAGRLVQRHLGSSIYGWTSVIGVLLAGLSLGNFLGGKIGDVVKNEKQASWLFLAASVLTLSILFLETQPKWIQDHFLSGESKSVLSEAISLSTLKFGPVTIELSWPYRILLVTAIVFFLPALSLGTVSPVVAKLAIDRLKRFKLTGTAIGQVYAWGMVGSIIGTFLTGFLLIDTLGTKGVILVLGTTMAFGATMLGSVWHAIWAGIPLGLCVIAFAPFAWFDTVGKNWGIREERGDPANPASAYAWVDESNYYYIKVNNEHLENLDTQRRTLVLDNLIHGYFILNHPEKLDYDYEHIYALVAYRAAKASGKVAFKPKAVSPEPPRDQPEKPAGASSPKAKETDKRAPQTGGDSGTPEPKPPTSPGAKVDRSGPLAGLRSVEPAQNPKENPKPAQTGTEKSQKGVPKKPSGEPIPRAPLADIEEESSVPPVERSSLATLFLGGGAYCFQRHIQFAYPGTSVDVAEIDPAVTRANFRATGLPTDTPIKTYWGDARQFVERHQDVKKYDLIFGDAFNDFSVPWHLTTREFNEKIKKMLTPRGVYMINIIDVYYSDAKAEEKAEREIAKKTDPTPAEQERIRQEVQAEARRYGGFVGAWTKTARLTFPHVYVFGTDDEPGTGMRETFVVVASMQELDLADLGKRADDPKFYHHERRTEPKPYGPEDLKAVDERARQIILTDDYAPVENLLAPVAETRADD
jgi:MFS family permease